MISHFFDKHSLDCVKNIEQNEDARSLARRSLASFHLKRSRTPCFSVNIVLCNISACVWASACQRSCNVWQMFEHVVNTVNRDSGPGSWFWVQSRPQSDSGIPAERQSDNVEHNGFQLAHAWRWCVCVCSAETNCYTCVCDRTRTWTDTKNTHELFVSHIVSSIWQRGIFRQLAAN